MSHCALQLPLMDCDNFDRFGFFSNAVCAVLYTDPLKTQNCLQLIWHKFLAVTELSLRYLVLLKAVLGT